MNKLEKEVDRQQSAQEAEREVLLGLIRTVGAASFKLMKTSESKENQAATWYYFYRQDGVFMKEKKVLYPGSFQISQILPIATLLETLKPETDEDI